MGKMGGRSTGLVWSGSMRPLCRQRSTFLTSSMISMYRRSSINTPKFGEEIGVQQEEVCSTLPEASIVC